MQARPPAKARTTLTRQGSFRLFGQSRECMVIMKRKVS
jgi:hypothetical protein